MVKSVGEHWVCSELARRGWAPALTRDGLSRTDILAVGVAHAGRPQIEVQVKAATQVRRTSWELGSTIGHLSLSDREWFVLVVVPRVGEPPEAYIMPRDHVAAAAYISHQDWLTDPTAPAGQRNAGLSRSRVLASRLIGYRDRWDLLDLPATDAPVLLPTAWKELATDSRVGLPPEHPWIKQMPDWPGCDTDDNPN